MGTSLLIRFTEQQRYLPFTQNPRVHFFLSAKRKVLKIRMKKELLRIVELFMSEAVLFNFAKADKKTTSDCFLHMYVKHEVVRNE